MSDPTPLIIRCLKENYRVETAAITHLRIGADMNACVYKVEADDQKAYFVKLKMGRSHDVSVEILELLHAAGIQPLILPIETIEGKKTQETGDYTLIVYPFVHGEDGFSRKLTDEQWISLGRALRKVHEVDVPASLISRLRREIFSPRWREAVRAIYANRVAPIEDEIAIDLWRFLQKNKERIERLVDRSESLSQKVEKPSRKSVLCHSDIHAGNVLIDDRGAFYIVDWDEPILAPKERDLMFMGGGVGNVWNLPYEEKLFYRGYGQTEIDKTLLSYYRYERILEDIALYSRELLQQAGKPDRALMFHHFIAQFAPRGVVDIAIETDEAL